MAVNLANRLKMLKQTAAAREPDRENPGIASAAQPRQPEPGWRELAPLVWFREANQPFSDGITPTGVVIPPETETGRLLFFDTETTGLSTGAGTIPFLASFGSLAGRTFTVRQYFLADYPGEPSYLESLLPEFAEDKILVSYNGRSFDIPLLRSRYLLNRIPLRQLPHEDLLYPARRFWKTVLPGCSLSEMEHSVLLTKRALDIPGAEAPDIWFRFVREGSDPRLAALFAHNLEDTVSLARLLHVMEALPGRSADLPFPLDRTGLALHLLKREDPRGRSLLESAAETGDRHSLRILSLLCRREGDWEKAAACWERLNAQGPSPFAAVELAKYCEHRLRDYERASGYVRELLAAEGMLPEGVREGLVKRLARIEKRLPGHQPIPCDSIILSEQKTRDFI
jgi:uncharacterized protein YprB with RNaseH-like and TPR domain